MIRTSRVTFRNRYSGATFAVDGEDAAARMDALAGWERV